MPHLRQGYGGQDRPPRIAAWLLASATPEHRREEMLGDLEELFQVTTLERGRTAARRWYWRQAANTIADAIRDYRNQPKTPGGDSLMQMLVQDLRYAFRNLVANPSFAVVAVLMLSLGIGANSTIFSWVNSVLLNPLPGSSQTQDLVQVTYLYRGDVLPSFSYPDYKDIAGAAKQVSGMTGFDDLAVGIVIDREAERAWAQIVTSNFFDVLGAKVVHGRTFSAEDEVPGSTAVVLSHAYWQRRFNADPGVIGRQIKINAQPFTVVGVGAPGFYGSVAGLSYDLWLPIGAQPAVTPGGNRLTARGNRWLQIIARATPAATHDQIRAELDGIIDGMRHSFAAEKRYLEHKSALFPMSNAPDGGIAVLRPVLLILSAVAGVVLLITCANLAGLLLARASSRQKEIAIRLSMGAGKWRIVQQLFVEGLVLAVLGAAGALIALRWTSGLLLGFAPPSELPIHLSVTLDATVVWFTAAVALGTVLLFALAPAAQAAPLDVATTLRDSGSAGRAFSRHRLRRGLVSAQVALSIALLVGAGLCLRSLNQAARMTPGFNPDGVVVGWLDLFSAGYTPDEGRAFYARVLERVSALPGVESATISRRVPLGFVGGGSSDITVDGYTKQERETQPFAGLNYVGPNYARTLQIPVVAGRDLTPDDRAGQPRVALVSEAMAKAYWKDGDAVGGRFMLGSPRPDQEPLWMTVVGVVKDIKQRTLTERSQPHVMIPIQQMYASTSVLNVRTDAGLDSIIATLQQAVRELDPAVPFYNVSMLSEHTKAATFQQKMAGDLLVVFGALALALAGIGSYGVLSYLVGTRRREIGIRLAIGATRGDVFRLIAGSGVRLIGAGLVAGLLLSVGVGMGLQSLLIGIKPTDPVTYAGVISVLLVVAGAACLIPARRAASLDPAITLRDE